MAQSGQGGLGGVFIYYRVSQADCQVAMDGVAALQAHLRLQHPGLVAECLRRPELGAQGEMTWMEVYRPAPGSCEVGTLGQLVAQALAQLVDATEGHALPEAGHRPRWWQGERHMELFVPVSGC